MSRTGTLLGCIADDFTGATDVANSLVQGGMRTTLLTEPARTPAPADADAIVVALKSRTTPPAEAVRDSLAALACLQEAGCRQFYFKYCSTFDSTPRGNIGPVAEALMQALHADFALACPAFPANARTVYKGHLFVGDTLLSDSGMRHHPLTPMTDSNLVRVLQAQTRQRVGLIAHETVARGERAIRSAARALQEAGHALAIADAIADADLAVLAHSCADMPLVTGASGLAQSLPDNFRGQGLLPGRESAGTLPPVPGLRAVIAGSCSLATQAQVHHMRERAPSLQIDVPGLLRGDDVAGDALKWAAANIQDGPVLVYTSAAAEEVRRVQDHSGVTESGAAVEAALSQIALGLVELGVRKLIVAGGETSGAVVQSLGVTGLRIGPEIDPGVPWTVSLDREGSPPLALALKSGNFGSEDFFLKAWNNAP